VESQSQPHIGAGAGAITRGAGRWHWHAAGRIGFEKDVECQTTQFEDVLSSRRPQDDRATK